MCKTTTAKTNTTIPTLMCTSSCDEGDDSSSASSSSGIDEVVAQPAALVLPAQTPCLKEEKQEQLLQQYEPEPVVTQSAILVLGFLIFAMAYIWPPLILLVAYMASRLIPYCFRTNDDACCRRMLFQQFRNNNTYRAWLPRDFCESPTDIVTEERFWVNKRGMCLCTFVMYPAELPIQAVLCFNHGYSDHSSFMVRVEHQRMVRRGIAVVYIEVEGHGRSDGASGLIPDWDVMTGDVRDYFQEVHQSERFRGKPFFLMGESMGGAVAYSVYRMIPEVFRGVIFQAPMCKISEELLPSKFVQKVLRRLIDPTSWTKSLGYLPLAPTDGTIAEKMGPNKECLALLNTCPTMYGRNPRLLTAKTMMVRSYVLYCCCI